MKEMVYRLLSSLKFWTMVLGIASTSLAKYGIEVSDEMVGYVAGFFGVLLLGQGLTDHGKEAAKVAATTTTTTVATVQPPNTEVVTSTTVPQ